MPVFSHFAGLERRTRAGGWGGKDSCVEFKKSFQRVWSADAIATNRKTLRIEDYD